MSELQPKDMSAAQLLEATINAMEQAGEHGRSRWYHKTRPDGTDAHCVFARAGRLCGLNASEASSFANTPRAQEWEAACISRHGKNISSLNWGPPDESHNDRAGFTLSLPHLLSKLRELKPLL